MLTILAQPCKNKIIINNIYQIIIMVGYNYLWFQQIFRDFNKLRHLFRVQWRFIPYHTSYIYIYICRKVHQLSRSKKYC